MVCTLLKVFLCLVFVQQPVSKTEESKKTLPILHTTTQASPTPISLRPVLNKTSDDYVKAFQEYERRAVDDYIDDVIRLQVIRDPNRGIEYLYPDGNVKEYYSQAVFFALRNLYIATGYRCYAEKGMHLLRAFREQICKLQPYATAEDGTEFFVNPRLYSNNALYPDIHHEGPYYCSGMFFLLAIPKDTPGWQEEFDFLWQIAQYYAWYDGIYQVPTYIRFRAYNVIALSLGSMAGKTTTGLNTLIFKRAPLETKNIPILEGIAYATASCLGPMTCPDDTRTTARFTNVPNLVWRFTENNHDLIVHSFWTYTNWREAPRTGFVWDKSQSKYVLPGTTRGLDVGHFESVTWMYWCLNQIGIEQLTEYGNKIYPIHPALRKYIVLPPVGDPRRRSGTDDWDNPMGINLQPDDWQRLINTYRYKILVPTKSDAKRTAMYMDGTFERPPEDYQYLALYHGSALAMDWRTRVYYAEGRNFLQNTPRWSSIYHEYNAPYFWSPWAAAALAKHPE